MSAIFRGGSATPKRFWSVSQSTTAEFCLLCTRAWLTMNGSGTLHVAISWQKYTHRVKVLVLQLLSLSSLLLSNVDTRQWYKKWYDTQNCLFTMYISSSFIPIKACRSRSQLAMLKKSSRKYPHPSSFAIKLDRCARCLSAEGSTVCIQGTQPLTQAVYMATSDLGTPDQDLDYIGSTLQSTMIAILD